MNLFKRNATLALAFAALCVGLALNSDAQVNRVPSVGTTDSAGSMQVNTEGQKNSYSATATGLAPAASATDVFCIAGSASKTVRVTMITFSGTAGTLVTVPVFLAKRAAADSGGTPATGNALPVAARHDANDAAATATLVSYTANPTINDASPGLLRAATVTLGTTAAATTNSRVVWDFADRPAKAVVLRGIAQQACVNLSGITVSSGLMNIDIEFTEE